MYYLSFTIVFRLPQWTAAERVNSIKKFQQHSLHLSFNSDWYVVFGEYFFVLFYSFSIKSWCYEFFELSLATTITLLTFVSCDYATSFNYDDKNTRAVGLICWYHLSNIMFDSIFYESMRLGITCSVLFYLCTCFFACLFDSLLSCFCFCFDFFCNFAWWWFCFPKDESDGIRFTTVTSMVVGNLRLWWT